VNPTICEACGHEVQAGDWPFCNRDGGPHQRSGTAQIIDDTLPGGARWMWNLGDEGVWVESKTQYREELAKRGLYQREGNSYNRNDKSVWATKTCLRPGQRDPFIHKASR
jgi:hypothetical protein